MVQGSTVFRCVCMFYDVSSKFILCVFRNPGYTFFEISLFIGFFILQIRPGESRFLLVKVRTKEKDRKKDLQKEVSISTGYPAISVHQSYHDHRPGPVPCRGRENGSGMPNTPKRFNDWCCLIFRMGFYRLPLTFC